MAYATVNDLERRWRALAPDERDRAEILLEDASAIIYTYAPNADENILSVVCCNMVRRAMTTAGDAFGVDGQTSDSLGWGASLPAGDLWLSAQDKLLMRGRGNIGTAKMADLNAPCCHG